MHGVPVDEAGTLYLMRIDAISACAVRTWSHISDSNGLPRGYKARALPGELIWHIEMGHGGFAHGHSGWISPAPGFTSKRFLSIVYGRLAVF